MSLEFEIGPNQLSAFVFEHSAGGDFTAMIDAFEFVEIGGAPQAAHFAVRDGVYHPFKARHEGSAGTHGTGLFGDVEGAALEPPVADGRRGLSDREHFGVGRGIFAVFDGVVSGGNDLAIAGDYAADGDLVLAPGIDCLVEGETHKKLVIADQLGRKPFFKRTRRMVVGGGRHGLVWSKALTNR